MTRYAQAKHMAITDPYWRAYLDGLEDKHRIRDNTREAEYAEANRLLQARLDRHLDNMQQATERYAFPAPVSNAADLGAPRVP